MSEIRKFLDLSTAHLTQATRDILDDKHRRPSPTYPHPEGYGWFVWVPTDSLDTLVDCPDDLKACYLAARKRHCDYILFDCDAPEVDFLPTYPDEVEGIPAAPGDISKESTNARLLRCLHQDGRLAEAPSLRGVARRSTERLPQT